MYKEIELIKHQDTNYNIFIVNMMYRTPHIHKEIEICLLLNGTIEFVSTTKDGTKVMYYTKGDIWLTSPFQSHEIKTKQPALILSLQIPLLFFSMYYTKIEHIVFNLEPINKSSNKYRKILLLLLRIAYIYFEHRERYELKSSGLIMFLFDIILSTSSYTIITEKEKRILKNRETRIQNIIEFIDKNFAQKLFLSTIAQKENLSLSYLSHFFKETFKMSFQEYLSKIRCNKASNMLLKTNLSLLDICLSCGFSDPKYFNKNFKNQYGYTPKNYRKHFSAVKKQRYEKISTYTVEEFISTLESINIIKKTLTEVQKNASTMFSGM